MKKYFVNLNEAVTEEMTKRFAKKLLVNPLFAEEMLQTREVIKNHPQAVTDSGKPLFDEDTFYAEIKGKSGSRTLISKESFTYQPERKVLNILINKLFDKNQDNFQDREEVFEVFAEGMMTGNILPVGKLIDGTFGRGTLRKIGELDEDIEAQQEFISQL